MPIKLLERSKTPPNLIAAKLSALNAPLWNQLIYAIADELITTGTNESANWNVEMQIVFHSRRDTAFISFVVCLCSINIFHKCGAIRIWYRQAHAARGDGGQKSECCWQLCNLVFIQSFKLFYNPIRKNYTICICFFCFPFGMTACSQGERMLHPAVHNLRWIISHFGFIRQIS